MSGIVINSFPGDEAIGSLQLIDIDRARDVIESIQRLEPEDLEDAEYKYDGSSVLPNGATLAFLAPEEHKQVLDIFSDLFVPEN